jgi:hypothetical protein
MLDGSSSMSIPFGETGGLVRGCLDLLCGRFPPFVFGASVGNLLPVFHFHDETRQDLEPKLRHLAENGYHTVTSDQIAAFVRGDSALGPRAVALCFDDAWASVWTEASALLAQYGLQAIVYAIPGRTADAEECRPKAMPAAGSPFMTWPELRALHRDGVVDVQSHTMTHARVFTANAVSGFVRPDYAATLLLNRPRVGAAPLRFVGPDDLGAPLYEHRSRMSDGPRMQPSEAAHDACVRLVAAEGGPAFFDRPDWEARLHAAADGPSRAMAPESDAEHRRAIDEELDGARAELNARLATRTVNHVCLPWGVSGGATAAALKRLGFATAFANRLPGTHAVRRGDDPYWLKRLPNRYIQRLPGRGRRWWFVAPPSPHVTAGQR